MKIFDLISILGVALVLPMSCAKDELANDSTGGEETPSVYEITAPVSEDFTVEVQESAEEGSEVPVTVTIVGEDLKVTSVKFNDSPCEFVSEDNLVYSYKFKMPSQDVEISVTTSKTAFSITWSDSGDYSISCSSSKAEPGDEINVTVTVPNLKYRPASVSYGSAGELCEQVGNPYFDNNDASKGYLYVDYRFTMPEKDADISVVLEENLNRIYRTSDENAAIRMRNRLYPDGYTPDIDETIENEYDAKVCMGVFEDPAYFAIEPIPGYNYSTPSVTGLWTERSYATEYVYEAQYGGWCYNLAMPAEPIMITVTATEENMYEGKEFIGSYSGFLLKVREGSLIFRSEEPTLNYELDKNTTYTISSTDENKFSGTGFYSFDEETNIFGYLFDDMQGNVWTEDTNAGLGGRYGQDVSLAYVANVAEPLPDYTKYYVASKDNGTATISDFISASSASGLTILTSFKLNGVQCYYWYDHSGMTLTKVDVEFLSGSSLADAGASALVRLDGQLFLKYAVEGDTPVFTTQGAEAGTYTGSAGDLVLDGFGNATLDGVEGTYELDGSILTFTDVTGTETQLLLNANDNSYSVISGDSGEWNGPMSFSVVSPNGVVGGQQKNALVELVLDGGYVHFRLAFDHYGSWEDGINTAISYVWDSAASTLTIAFVNFVGNPISIEQGNGAYPSLGQIVFKVSADKKSLEFTGIETLYARYNSNYLPLDGVVLTAVE